MSSTPEKIDKYVVLGELGRGAMGTVYKARDPVLDRLVAIKMMSEELVIEEEMRGRFNREAKSVAKLQHPNIVTIFDFGELENAGVPYIVMELLDGTSLAQMMEDAKPERLEDKVHIVTQICRGLDYAHKRGVIHRDIKPKHSSSARRYRESSGFRDRVGRRLHHQDKDGARHGHAQLHGSGADLG